MQLKLCEICFPPTHHDANQHTTGVVTVEQANKDVKLARMAHAVRTAPKGTLASRPSRIRTGRNRT